ncbi:hypothetical protein [Paraburkholderia terrae]|uniref:hypothetical protein n=1 Tax=Paraburkholderia terrae TaxID=311230 RepID=UPI0020BD85AC|nr:hypothetical protein [Paraburkholderia terrae]
MKPHGELLCYLVVGELAAMARTRDWLKTSQRVELAHIWVHRHHAAAWQCFPTAVPDQCIGSQGRRVVGKNSEANVVEGS